MRLAVIDYGMGNLLSVQKAFEYLGFTVDVTRDKNRISSADKVILPGVGAFPNCMANLERFDLVNPLIKTIKSGKPFLGICLGMQLLMSESEEFGSHRGLDLISGKVLRFPVSDKDDQGWGEEDLSKQRNVTDKTAITSVPNLATLKIPHMGWNTLQIRQTNNPIFEGLPNDPYVYFVHSYYVVPEDFAWVACTTDYGLTFCSGFRKDNVFALQFHPEKSQEIGLQILKNFANLEG